MTRFSLSGAARTAWNQSVIAEFPPHAAARLAEDARERRLDAGEKLYRTRSDGGPGPLHLIVDGLVRVYMHTAAGRQITVRYVLDGDLLGVPALVAGRSNSWLAADAVTSVHALVLPGRRLAHLAANDVGVAWPLARYVANLVHATEELWVENMFQPVRTRVARHLLDLAVRDEGLLLTRVSQEELASAIGSVREVVARVLKCLDDERLIDRGHGRIVIRDAAALHRVSLPAVER